MNLTQQEATALLELLAVCSTVFDDDPTCTQGNPTVALRRIQKATLKAETTFAQAPIIGKGAGHST